MDKTAAPMFVLNYDDPCNKLNDFDTNIHHNGAL